MQRLMRGTVLVGFLGLGASTLHCGGEAIIDPPLGSGGSSSSNSNSNSSATTDTTSTTMSVTVTTTGPQSECEIACGTLYDCGAEDGRCPGFEGTPDDRELFLRGPSGNDGCVATCDANPLLINLVNADDCDTSVNNLKAASLEFAESCDEGL